MGALAMMLPASCLAREVAVLSNNLTLGRAGYWTNASDIEVFPVPRFAASAGYAQNRTATPFAETRRQGELGVRADLGRYVTLSAGGSYYAADRGPVIDDAGNVVGFADGRVAKSTVGLRTVLRLLNPGPGLRGKPELSVDLGVAGGWEAIPVFTGTADPATWRLLDDRYDLRDRSASVGAFGKVRRFSLSVAYAVHDYSDNASDIEAAIAKPQKAHGRSRGSAKLLRGSIADAVLGSVGAVAEGLPVSEAYVRMAQAVHRDWSVSAAYDYGDMIEAGQIARQTTVGLAWQPASWIQFRIGAYWVNQFHRNSRYSTAGISLFS
jgi:hypothetical protein